MPSDAAVIFIHNAPAGLDAHLARFRREAGAVLPVFVAANTTQEQGVPEFARRLGVDFFIRPSDRKRVTPSRDALAARSGILSTFADRNIFVAARHPLLSTYDRIWFLEYDVDFAGDWGSFFADFAGPGPDLLMTRLRTRPDDPRWVHWRWFQAPAEMPVERHIAGMHAIVRMTRPLIDALHIEFEGDKWNGHAESLIPSIAAHSGFSIGDINNTGEFAADPKGRHWAPVWAFRFKPAIGGRYYATAPRNFLPGRLYHPVKPEKSLRGGLVPNTAYWIAWWVHHRLFRDYT
jgi:hypothetical protein